MNKIVLSVHGLVDFALRSGDIDTRVFNIETMTRGSQLHAYYQAKQNKRYLAEQYLEHTFVYDRHEIVLQGRVDGIIVNDDEVVIEEIKTTNADLDRFFEQHELWHLGQAQCYALIYVLKNKLDTIKIQLTYISQVDERKMLKRYQFTKDELTSAINTYFATYFSFYDRIEAYETARTEALKTLTFPFKKIRPSQQMMMDEVTEGLMTSRELYFNAPTGSGKTMAVLYPALKRLVEKPKTKIFYLTAKGSGKTQAENALRIIARSAQLKSINLSAKDKMCINDKVACNPDECPFAKNYYGKVKNALFDIYANYDQYTPNLLVEVAKKHEVCPFEFQLDLSLLSDVIIGDYNYLFDPFVYLRRFFDQKQGEYIVLVDEAHNLPRRVMDNYSLTLDFTAFYTFRKLMKGPVHKEIRSVINKMVKVLVEYSVDMIAPYETINEFPSALLSLLEKFILVGSPYMQEQGNALIDSFADFFFAVNKFLKILQMVDENFVLFTEIDNDKKFFPKFYIKCLNPAKFINASLKGVDHTIFFSATLAPETYFKTMLGMKTDISHIPNPFKKEQLLILVDPTVSLYFKDRDGTLDEVADKILAAIDVKIGNYLVYAPSFSYLEGLLATLMRKTGHAIVAQTQQMSDGEKERFLDQFALNPQTTKIGLAVLGGSFSEGVDLVSDRLSGVVILGVGYPPPSFEKKLEETYFDQTTDNGMMYAFVYPALNKILQTMGRVIRTENDKGFILLMDKRYQYQPYRDHLESYHGLLTNVRHAHQISAHLSSFFFD